MKVVVTGGAGFIGSHVVDALRARDIQVLVFDRNELHDFHRSDVEFQLGDVRDPGAITTAIDSCDGVIHLAATLGTQETINRSRYITESNILGSLNVFKGCRDQSKKGVYITVGNHWMNNPYSITKSLSERFALMFNREFGTRIAVVRGLNAYGPRQKQFPVRKIMPNFIVPSLKGEPITIYGSGNQIMDMIYVEDLAELMVRALILDHDVYDACFEAGMGEDTTVNDLAEAVVDMTASDSPLNHVGMRPGEIPESVVKADISLLRKLDWLRSDFTPLDAGISATINWYSTGGQSTADAT